MKPEKRLIEALAGIILSVSLVLGSWLQWLPLPMTEVFGFITGGLSVYLTIRRNIWLWPTGMVNNIFFGKLFWDAGLYADMGLQVVYFVLSLIGWYWWLHGGEKRTELPVRRAAGRLLVLSLIFVLTATVGMKLYLEQVNGSSPLWDGMTTALSLAAQYLLTRKYLENWFFWIAADLIYIPLYVSKGLYLTAGLYSVFLLMCLAGLADWRRALREREGTQSPLEPMASPS